MKEGVSSVHDTPSSVNLLSVKDFEAIVLFSEIIIVLLQAYLLYNNVWQRKMSKIQESKQKIRSV